MILSDTSSLLLLLLRLAFYFKPHFMSVSVYIHMFYTPVSAHIESFREALVNKRTQTYTQQPRRTRMCFLIKMFASVLRGTYVSVWRERKGRAWERESMCSVETWEMLQESILSVSHIKHSISSWSTARNGHSNTLTVTHRVYRPGADSS